MVHRNNSGGDQQNKDQYIHEDNVTVTIVFQYMLKGTYIVNHFLDIVDVKSWNTPTIFSYIQWRQ